MSCCSSAMRMASQRRSSPFGLGDLSRMAWISARISGRTLGSVLIEPPSLKLAPAVPTSACPSPSPSLWVLEIPEKVLHVSMQIYWDILGHWDIGYITMGWPSQSVSPVPVDTGRSEEHT